MSKSDESKGTTPPLECTACGKQMKHLAHLPLTGAFPASRVYRCYNCDHVVQQTS
jgi:DNA-directed RNA polymerase subunit RPC12/RpoP